MTCAETTSEDSSLWTKAFVEPTHSGFWQLFRFGLTGVLATMVDYTVMLTLYSLLHLPEQVAVAVGYSAGLVICYILSVIWIFPQRSVGNKHVEFTVFVVIGVIGLLLTGSIVHVIRDLMRVGHTTTFGLSDEMQLSLAKAVAIVIVFFFNFVARRALLFRSSASAQQVSELSASTSHVADPDE